MDPILCTYEQVKYIGVDVGSMFTYSLLIQSKNMFA